MKLGEFKTPIGTTGNAFSIGSWWSMILGVLMFLATFALGQRLGNAVGAKIPLLNTHPQQPFAPMPTAAPANSQIYWG